MNNGNINGSSINGNGFPSWVIRAAAIATAAAIAVSAAPKRVVYGHAYGNAAVAVTVSQNKIIHGFATGICSASADVNEIVTFSGSAIGTAGATGYIFALLATQSSAFGQASCFGYALMAQQLGDASVTSGATVVDATAYRIKKASCNVTCGATGSASGGDIKRYGKVLASCGVISPSIEASVMLSGDIFYRHDGYCIGNASASASIDPDKTSVITTIGVFNFGNGAVTQANAYVCHPGSANVSGLCTAQPVNATFIFKPTAASNATAVNISANGVRMVLPTVSASASAKSNNPKAKMRYVATSTGVASANAVTSMANKVVYSDCLSIAGALVVKCDGTRVLQGRVNAAIATALVGRAYGITNSEISAPDERYMIVEFEDRSMIVDFEDRTILVAA